MTNETQTQTPDTTQVNPIAPAPVLAAPAATPDHAEQDPTPAASSAAPEVLETPAPGPADQPQAEPVVWQAQDLDAAIATMAKSQQVIQAFVGGAPPPPYYLMDTEHGKINEIASHLDKLRDVAITAIEQISTEFNDPVVAKYKGDVLVWLHGQ